MRTVLISATQFGLKCLEAIARLPSVDLVGIVTSPQTFRISYRPEGVKNVRHVDFQPIAKELEIPLWMMKDKMTDPGLLDEMKAWNPELVIVAGWYHMIPETFRNLAPTLGLHGSLLPDYSGGAPLVWALINGEERTGMTLFLLDDGVDSGPILGQQEVSILLEDTIATLVSRVEEAGVELLRKHLPLIASGEAVYTSQDESKRRIMPQRGPEDGLIDWNWPARRIYDFIRAQTMPYPGAFTHVETQKVTIWKASLSDSEEDASISPGDVSVKGTSNKPELLVCCGDGGSINVRLLSIDDGPPMAAGTHIDIFSRAEPVTFSASG